MPVLLVGGVPISRGLGVLLALTVETKKPPWRRGQPPSTPVSAMPVTPWMQVPVWRVLMGRTRWTVGTTLVHRVPSIRPPPRQVSRSQHVYVTQDTQEEMDKHAQYVKLIHMNQMMIHV